MPHAIRLIFLPNGSTKTTPLKKSNLNSELICYIELTYLSLTILIDNDIFENKIPL